MKSLVVPFFPFLFCISMLQAQSPVGDCLGAIPVCQQIYQEDQSPTGGGNVLEINDNFNCMQVESNSIWYTFTVNESGDFGFVLTPNDPLDDYDWALFDITNANCEDLFSNPDLIVSCNAAGGTGCIGPTGATGDSNYNNQGFNCGQAPPNTQQGFSSFNDLVPVEAGNTYVLCVSNWTGSINGYELDFGLSSGIGIFDEMSPEIESVALPEDCQEDEITFFFSEFIQCETIDNLNFLLAGQGGPYTLTLSSVNCDAGGNFAKEFVLGIDPPLNASGTYELSLLVDGSTEALDLCDNPAEPQTFTFSIVDFIVPVDLGPDVSLCQGESLLLDATAEEATYEWQDGSSQPTFEVTEAGTYWVRVTNECGSNIDSVEVSIEMPLPVVELGNDTTLCPGESIVLETAIPNIDHQWQDGSTATNLTVTTPGTYSVTVTSACEEQTDAIQVDYLPEITASLEDAGLCQGESLTLDVSTTGATYLWQDGSSDATVSVTEAGIYTVTITTPCEESVLTATIELVNETPMVSLGPDTSLCYGETLNLDIELPGATYVWQDGSTSGNYTVSESGEYAVTVSNACGVVSDAIAVHVFEPLSVDLGRDTFLCPGTNLVLDATHPSATFYQWQNNSEASTFPVSAPGVVSVIVGNECETVSGSLEVLECEVCEVYVPNAFSPNDDGINDQFLPFSDCMLEEYELKIFDRWGSIVFESDAPTKGWTGAARSEKTGTGVYVWMLRFTVIENNQPREVEMSGDVLVVR